MEQNPEAVEAHLQANMYLTDCMMEVSRDRESEAIGATETIPCATCGCHQAIERNRARYIAVLTCEDRMRSSPVPVAMYQKRFVVDGGLAALRVISAEDAARIHIQLSAVSMALEAEVRNLILS